MFRDVAGFCCKRGPMSRRRIVVVDDERVFATVPLGADVHYARTSAQGVETLKRLGDRRIDELWLDHDLGGDDTTRPIVSYLVARSMIGQRVNVSEVYVHSANPPAAQSLVAQLEPRYQTRRVGLDGLVQDSTIAEARRLHDESEALGQRMLGDPSLSDDYHQLAQAYDEHLETNLDELSHITDGCMGEEIQRLVRQRERGIDRDFGIEI